MRSAIVVAGGSGQRMGYKKQFATLAGEPMWVRAVQAMLQADVSIVCLVCPSGDIEEMKQQLGHYLWGHRCNIVGGGSSRFLSVQAGVIHLYHQFADSLSSLVVGIHDAARPFVSREDVVAVFEEAEAHGAAILGQPCRDTVKVVDGQRIERTIPRASLFLAQTPQVFCGDLLYDAYLKELLADEVTVTDDAAVMESLGVTVHCVSATGYNGKVTTPDDMVYAKWLAERVWGAGEAE